MNTTQKSAGTREEAPPQKAYAGPSPSEIRLRAFIIGLLIIPADNLWVLMMEKVRHGPYPTVISIFVNTIFILTVLTAINAIVRRARPRWSLSTAEMLVIYTMVTISTALAGHDMIPTLVAQMGYPWWRADEANNWANTFIPSLPTWLSVTQLSVLDPLYKGGTSLYANGYWRFWLMPSLYWASFMFVLVFVMMCINTLVRKQWIEHERLTFPIVQLPLAMTEPKGTMWRSKLFWIAFGITFGVELVNGIAIYFPQMPRINLGFEDHNLAAGLVSQPWAAIGWTPFTLYPFVVGLGYLLPTDLIFSTWFFYLFWKAEKVTAAVFGMDVGFYDPHIRHQAFGGVAAIVLVLLWSSRGYLKQVWLRIISAESTLDDSDEPMSYRSAALGAAFGVLFLVLFLKQIGMSPLVALAAFAVYFVIAIAITRIRAELGPPIHDMPFGPDFITTSTLGLGRFSHGDMVGLSYFSAFHGGFRSHPMPIGIEGMKMAQSTRASQRKFLWAILLAALLGAAATFWAYLHLGYKYGLAAKWNYGAAWAWEVCKKLTTWWEPSAEAATPEWGGNAAMSGGFIFCMLLSYIRLRVFNWPFHPIGFVISGAYQVNLVWVPLLIAWIIKVNVLRYGGLKVYKAAMPFFFGLIVGQLSMGCMWGIIGIVFNIPYYNFFAA